MELENMPKEILILILKYLDTESIMAVYDTSNYFKQIISGYDVVKSCKFSLSSLATVNSLKSPFFRDISFKLVELNLMAVPDLNKTKLLTALKRTKNLATLNVSYTNISLMDLVHVYKVCPTIKNVSVNFVFERKRAPNVPENVLIECQKLFSNFTNIELVGTSCNLYYSGLALFMLHENHNKGIIKFQVVNLDHPTYKNRLESNFVTFRKLHICMLNWKHKIGYNGCMNNSNLIRALDLNSLEFFVIKCDNYKDLCVFVSPVFQNFFSGKFGVVEKYNTDMAIIPKSANIIFQAWPKESTNFDETFFEVLYQEVKQYFPRLLMHEAENHNGKFGFDDERSFFHICCDTQTNIDYLEVQPKRKKVVPKPIHLDYDDTFGNTPNIQICLESKLHHLSLIISPKFCYLSKITYLNLNCAGRYSNNFFPTLFKCCVSLKTLNIESNNPVALVMANSIKYSSSLKNIRLVEPAINLESLLSRLSDCEGLENVHINNPLQLRHDNLEAIFGFVQKCDKLYSLFIEAFIQDAYQLSILSRINKMKLLINRGFLNVQIGSMNNYDPYLSVFCLNPIKHS